MSKVRHRFQLGMRTALLLLTLTCVCIAIIRIVFPPQKSVLVATQRMGYGNSISSDNVQWEYWPMDLIPNDAITTGETPSGEIVVAELRSGQALVREDILSEGEYRKRIKEKYSIPASHQIVYVRPQPQFSRGIIEPGDIVDVVPASSSDETAGVPLVSKTRVFCIKFADQSNGYRGSAGLLLSDDDAAAIAELNSADSLDLILHCDPE